MGARTERLRWVAALAASLSAALIAAASASAAVYVGDGSTSGKVWQFAQAGTGALNPLTPPSIDDTGRTAQDVVLSPDGSSAYVTENVSATGAGTGVYEFNVNPDGTLTPKPTPMIAYGAAAPTGSGGPMAITPDGTSLYVADFDGRIWQFTIGAGGQLSAKVPANVPGTSVGTGKLVISPKGTSVYAIQAAAGGGSVLQYDIGTGGLLKAKNPQAAPLPGATTATSLVITPDGTSVYVTADDSHIYQFDVGAGGKLAPKSTPTVTSTDPVLGNLAITPDGKHVYVGGTPSGFCNDGPSEILEYNVGSGGQLQAAGAIGGAPKFSGEHDLAVSPDGKHLYAAESCLIGDVSGIAVYDIGLGGTLSANANPFDATGPNALGLAITPLPSMRMLTVSRAGTGSGAVSGSGISCPSTCKRTYSPGSSVTLVAKASPGSVFAGWGGACSGTGGCSVTMTANRQVTAIFNRAPKPVCHLTVKKYASKAITVSATCSQAASAKLTGTVTVFLGNGHSKHKQTFHLGPVHVTLVSGVAKTLKLSIPKAARKGTKPSGTLTLAATNANGSARVVVKIKRI